MKDERTRAMLTATGMSVLLLLLPRAQTDDGREREVMIICCVDNEQRTLNRKIEREREQEARLGALKNTYIQTYISMPSFLSISPSFTVVSVLYH